MSLPSVWEAESTNLEDIQNSIDNNNNVIEVPSNSESQFIPPPPLQYVSLFGECQPTDGHVKLNKLSNILNKTGISGTDTTEILKKTPINTDQQVSETDFYKALAQAACIQQGQPLPLTDTSELEMQSLELNIESKYKEVQELEYTIQDFDLHVKVCEKQAGSLLNKYSTFTLTGHFNSEPVNLKKRFSDFASLRERLIAVYPFRIVPLAPPKILSVNGRYLTNEDQDTFLIKRAQGLSRFINLVVQHPVLGQSNCLKSFLNVCQEIGLETSISETKMLAPSPQFISQWSDETEDQWDSIELACKSVQNDISVMCSLFDRLLKRAELDLADYKIFSRNCLSVYRSMPKLYPNSQQQQDLGSIEHRIRQLSEFAEQVVDARTVDLAVFKLESLEKLKIYRDMLNSILDTFARAHTLGSTTISEEEKLIENTKLKLENLEQREVQPQDRNRRAEEVYKLKQTIQRSQQSIKDQTAEQWNMRICLYEEFRMSEGMQYQISVFLRSLSRCWREGTAKFNDLMTQLCDDLSSSPMQV